MSRLTTVSTWLAIVLWCSMLAASGDSAVIHPSPSERVLFLFAEPVSKRLVVTGEDGRLDVWLFSKQPFTKTSARLKGAAEVSLSLPDGFTLSKATWVAATQQWWAELIRAGDRHRIRAFALGDQSVFVLHGAGDRRDARPWTPRYRPKPLPLLHESMCRPSASGLD
ncbi:MAG TPA: hypothetical protein DCQ06_12540 [Myxococcales bacterium]|nr:hypothetical protein [Myxococcales bacterium]HAN32415.1 hypothetical protein [Myxococcales bacterium]